ncbi:MAG: family 1 glycosylhydrolase [Candidatus Sulfotelmatobacter sp.]
MDRRQFLNNSLSAAGGAWLAHRALAAEATVDSQQIASQRIVQQKIFPQKPPGAISSPDIESARFPSGFLWGMATACDQVEGAWNLDPRLTSCCRRALRERHWLP